MAGSVTAKKFTAKISRETNGAIGDQSQKKLRSIWLTAPRNAKRKNAPLGQATAARF